MDNSRTYPIAVIPSAGEQASPGPRLLRRRILRYAHVAVSAVGGLIIPGVTAIMLAIWHSQSPMMMGETWGKALAFLVFAAALAAGSAKCSISYFLTGIGGLAIAGLMPAQFIGATVLVELALLMGLGVAHTIYGSLRARSGVDVAASRDELNARCTSCHARSFCPFQPGGLADRYSTPEQKDAGANGRRVLMTHALPEAPTDERPQ